VNHYPEANEAARERRVAELALGIRADAPFFERVQAFDEYQKVIDDEIVRERYSQNIKWTPDCLGIQKHDIMTWMTVLFEEVGEAAQAALTFRFKPSDEATAHLRYELIQSAAVIKAIIERIDARDGNL
jgi:hypothetical protein